MENYLSEIHTRLQRLRPYSNVQLRKLSGQAEEDLTALVRYTNMLHNTPAYNDYHTLIKQSFGGLPQIIPGTVGAYFGGCLLDLPSNVPSNCTPVCVGGVPKPDQGLCQYKVIEAVKEPYGYRFETLYDTDGDKALVYVNGFNGFSSAEKSMLQDKGIEEINVISMSNDGRNYLATDLKSGAAPATTEAGFLPLSQVTTRQLQPDTICMAQSQEPDTSIIWIMFGIIVVLIAMITIALLKPK